MGLRLDVLLSKLRVALFFDELKLVKATIERAKIERATSRTLSARRRRQLGATGAFNVAYVFTGEVFPASVRGAGFGLCNVFARVGGLLAPFSAVLPPATLFFAYAALAAAAGAATLRCLDETLGRPLASAAATMVGESESGRASPNRSGATRRPGQ